MTTLVYILFGYAIMFGLLGPAALVLVLLHLTVTVLVAALLGDNRKSRRGRP